MLQDLVVDVDVPILKLALWHNELSSTITWNKGTTHKTKYEEIFLQFDIVKLINEVGSILCRPFLMSKSILHMIY